MLCIHFEFIWQRPVHVLLITLDYCTRGNGSLETGVKENVFVGAFGTQKIPDRKSQSHPSHMLLSSDMQVASPPQTDFQTAVGRASIPSHTRLYLCIPVNMGYAV